MSTSAAPVRILMVCLGNICRSPTAHGVMEKVIADNDMSEVIEVDSAGTSTYHLGENPDPRSISAAARRGYRLDDLVARQVQDDDFHAFDYILAMDRSNLRSLKSSCPPAHQRKLRLLLEFGDSSHDAVPDPYYSGADGFELVLDLVEESCQGLLQHILRHDLAT